MRQQQRLQLDQQPAQLVGRGLAAQAEGGLDQHAVARGEVLDLHRTRTRRSGIVTTVRSGVRMRVERRPMSSTVPVAVAEAAEVADADRLVGDQREAAEEVLERLLRRQRDREAADAETGHQTA